MPAGAANGICLRPSQYEHVLRGGAPDEVFAVEAQPNLLQDVEDLLRLCHSAKCLLRVRTRLVCQAVSHSLSRTHFLSTCSYSNQGPSTQPKSPTAANHNFMQGSHRSHCMAVIRLRCAHAVNTAVALWHSLLDTCCLTLGSADQKDCSLTATQHLVSNKGNHRYREAHHCDLLQRVRGLVDLPLRLPDAGQPAREPRALNFHIYLRPATVSVGRIRASQCQSLLPLQRSPRHGGCTRCAHAHLWNAQDTCTGALARLAQQPRQAC